MIIRLLDKEEVVQIYQNKMPGDFAKGEIKPLERILELSERNQYFCYGIFETGTEEKMISYCFLVTSAEKDAVLLDYFAVTADVRGMGYGSRCLALLKEEIGKKKMGTLILEVENPRYGADEADRELRRRRIAFYIRNGMSLTPLRIFLYQVEYLVMTSDEKQMMKTAEQIYHVYQVLLKADKIKTRLNISTNIRCVILNVDINIKHGSEDGIRRTEELIKEVKKKGILVLTGVNGPDKFKAILKENDIEPEECMFFGNSDRDIEMLRYAGIGITAENASYLAKNASNYIAKPYKQGGFADILEEILQILNKSNRQL